MVVNASRGQRPLAGDWVHHPQQSDLKPQTGQRHTACIRYASAPQRSHSALVSPAAAVLRADLTGVIGRSTGSGSPESGMREIIVMTSPNYLRSRAPAQTRARTGFGAKLIEIKHSNMY
jgi:hypothetical protein